MRAPRFILDVMLGSLAKWLRFLGLDTRYSNDMDDPELVQLALEEDRVLITRDVPLAGVPGVEGRVLLVRSEALELQLREVARAYPSILSPGRAARCGACNVPLEVVSDMRAVEPLVPSYVYLTQRRFSRCPSCGKIFWEGTHKRRMQMTIEELRLDLG